MRNVITRVAAGAAIGGSLLFTAGLGLAGAQPDNSNNKGQDGLVNVSIGNIGVLQDVTAASAAQIAAAVCNTEVGPVTTMAEAVDVDGGTKAVCTNNLGAIDLQQNGPGRSENAPGRTGATPTSAPTPTSATPKPAPAAEAPVGQSR
jgi:hypothetical protein